MGCSVCGKTKAGLNCGVCNCTLCKSCAEFLPQGELQYIDVRPAKLDSGLFCVNCYTTDVVPEIEKYEEILARAKDIAVFDITQSKETRLLKRLEPPITVEHCLDPFEATMKMAYIAAKLNFNSIVDTNIKTIKIRDGSYQTSECSGVCIPTLLSEAKLLKDRSLRSNPN